MLIALAGVAMSILAWLCTRDPTINFLPKDRRAEWILFPAAPDARTHHIANLDATFRREFTLQNRPRIAQLHVRAAKRVELRINGRPVEIAAPENWKNISTVDVLAFLQTGANVIEARAFNDTAPPLLWLALVTDQLNVSSDQTWDASFAGSAWRRAALASTPRIPRAGNAIAGGERTLSAFARIWPLWFAFAGCAAVIWAARGWWVDRWRSAIAKLPARLSQYQTTVFLILITGLWIILFWNNARSVPADTGFDSRFHIDYIKYVQERHALPLPTEGYEMFQPPLYYVLSAATLSFCKLSVTNASGLMVLRFLTMLFGIAHVALVFLTLRLLFPGQIGRQLVGLLLAAFLPMQLYLSHYVTNETLAATLVTAAVYLSVRALRTENASVHAWLGFCLGAALLTKATALLLVPILLTALIAKLARQRVPIAIWLRTLGVMLIACIAVCGWHYVRIWHRFGTPFVGNWDVSGGFLSWQDPGYHTAADYLRFGQSLVSPLFSSFNGFADGIYSTLWGDGLCGGVSELAFRPPWNYDLMTGGYLLALVPSLLVLIGAVIAIQQFVRKPSAEWFLLLALSGALSLAMIFMTCKVASYAQIKAFYGLSMLAPLCFLGVIGWDALTRGRNVLQFALGAVLILWAVNSFGSFWIRQSAYEHVTAGLRLQWDGKTDAAISEAQKAIDCNPADATARRFFGSVLDDAGQLDKAIEQTTKATELSPMESESHAQLGRLLSKQGQMEAATREAARAVELGPENSSAYELLFTRLRESGHTQEAINVARDGLAVSPFNGELHYRLGLALGQQKNFATAINHFAYANLLRPDRPEPASALHLALILLVKRSDTSRHLLDIASSAPESPQLLTEVAWLLATNPRDAMRNGQEAVRLAEHAYALTHRKSSALLRALAAAYAEAGKFDDAIHTAEEAFSFAQSSGDAAAAALSQNLLDSFRAKQPYREEPIVPR